MLRVGLHPWRRTCSRRRAHRRRQKTGCHKTKKAAVTAALEEYVRQERLELFFSLAGTIDNDIDPRRFAARNGGGPPSVPTRPRSAGLKKILNDASGHDHKRLLVVLRRAHLERLQAAELAVRAEVLNLAAKTRRCALGDGSARALDRNSWGITVRRSPRRVACFRTTSPLASDHERAAEMFTVCRAAGIQGSPGGSPHLRRRGTAGCRHPGARPKVPRYADTSPSGFTRPSKARDVMPRGAYCGLPLTR